MAAATTTISVEQKPRRYRRNPLEVIVAGIAVGLAAVANGSASFFYDLQNGPNAYADMRAERETRASDLETATNKYSLINPNYDGLFQSVDYVEDRFLRFDIPENDRDEVVGAFNLMKDYFKMLANGRKPEETFDPQKYFGMSLGYPSKDTLEAASNEEIRNYTGKMVSTVRGLLEHVDVPGKEKLDTLTKYI